MIQNLFHAMGILAMNTLWTFVEKEISWADSLVTSCGDETAHLVLVMICRWVASQPTNIHLYVGEPTKFVVMVISFRTPGASKLACLVLTHLPKDVRLS
jgi:hypothetical protein